MTENFANLYQTTLSAAITGTGDTTCTVTSVTGAPAVNFRIKIDDELMLVTGVSSLTLTITRGIEGTSAATHSNGATVTHILTAGGLLAAINSNTQAYLGTTSIGASFDSISTRRHYVKKITLPVDCFISSIDVYLKGNGSQVSDYAGIIIGDSSGTPTQLLTGQPSGVGKNTIYLDTTGRWYSFPAGLYLSAGTYWFGFVSFLTSGGAVQVAYDTGGSDSYYLGTGDWVSDLANAGSLTGTSNNYSIRVNTTQKTLLIPSTPASVKLYAYNNFR